jgi:hypothetical protein
MVPINLSLDVCMIMAARSSSLRWSIGAQFANQTYNALHYYANRNATHHDSTEQRLMAYAAATTASVVSAVTIQTMRPPGSTLRLFAPWMAVCVANCVNMPIIRSSEWLGPGVAVVDAADGTPCGNSRVCGAYAVGVCLFSRVAAATPTLLVPPLVLKWIESRRGVPLPRPVRLPLLLGLTGANMCCGVPLVFGIFAQQSTLPASLCEASVVRPDGSRPHEVVFNRGL